MRRASIPEALDVVFCSCALRVDGRLMLSHLCGEQAGIVDTLSTRADLLTPHEHVVRVREKHVLWRWHCVRWADGEWELVKRVEVGVVLFENEPTELLLLGRPTLPLVEQLYWPRVNLRQVVILTQFFTSFA
jgi:hypothetical protein